MPKIGPLSSISTANKSIYVDKEAIGAGDGTSWANAFTTIRAFVDSLEDMIVHAYTAYIRHGTKKTGTADADVLNKLHDTGEFPVATTWAGRRVFNINTGNWGVVSARDSDDQLSIIDTAGVALDLFPAGNEAYVIEPTPYREQVELNGDPATYPAHLILGTLTIEAEHYWQGTCEANVNVGEVKDTAADFSNVELGDRVWVLDRNGANDRAQDYEVGTVDDISQIGAGIVRTNLAKTPTTKWDYVIVKAEISGSDDGTEAGTARDYCFRLNNISNITINGFYYTFSDSYFLYVNQGSFNINASYLIAIDCDYAVKSYNHSNLNVTGAYLAVSADYSVGCIALSHLYLGYSAINSTGLYGVICDEVSAVYITRVVIDNVTRGVSVGSISYGFVSYSTINNTVATGLLASNNACIKASLTTNNATAPVDPVGTVEGAYIG